MVQIQAVQPGTALSRDAKHFVRLFRRVAARSPGGHIVLMHRGPLHLVRSTQGWPIVELDSPGRYRNKVTNHLIASRFGQSHVADPSVARMRHAFEETL